MIRLKFGSVQAIDVKPVFLQVLAITLLSLFLAGCSLDLTKNPMPIIQVNENLGPESPIAGKTLQQVEVQTPIPDRLTPALINEVVEATAAYFTPTITPIRSPTATVMKLCSPLVGHSLLELREIITNPFQPPPPGKDTGHHGVDFAYYRRGDRLSILGVPIDSALPGKVAARIENRPPYGNMLIVESTKDEIPGKVLAILGIQPGESLYLLYAHMKDAPTPVLGERVSCGQSLGEVGNTPAGWSSDPHLHFESRVGPSGTVFEGMAFYDTRASVEEMDNYRQWRMSGDFRLIDPMEILSYLE